MKKPGGPRSYPRQLLINQRHWKIRFSRLLETDDPQLETWGLADEETRTISLLYRMDNYHTFKILLHEVLHAIEAEYGLPIPHALIYKLEAPLAHFLVTNWDELDRLVRAKGKPPTR